MTTYTNIITCCSGVKKANVGRGVSATRRRNESTARGRRGQWRSDGVLWRNAKSAAASRSTPNYALAQHQRKFRSIKNLSLYQHDDATADPTTVERRVRAPVFAVWSAVLAVLLAVVGCRLDPSASACRGSNLAISSALRCATTRCDLTAS